MIHEPVNTGIRAQIFLSALMKWLICNEAFLTW